MCDEKIVQTAFDKVIVQIENASQAEQDLLMEMVGASVEKICINDEVRYMEKYYRTKTAEVDNSPMVVVKTEKIDNKLTDTNKTVTLYNRANCQFIEAMPSVLELVTLEEST